MRGPHLVPCLCVLAVLAIPVALQAQFAMPDAREMSGIPRPVDDLPPGTVSVRVIRGDLSNNIPNQPVELRVGDQVRTAQTDEGGRAQFSGFPAGAVLKAVTTVDGERLESQEFPAPSGGGIRLMLVATDKEREARERAQRAAPAVPGAVILGGDSRIVVEPDEETVRVFYLLEIVNGAQTPVEPSTPFIFTVPTGALGTTILQGSAPQASASGDVVRVLGPFPPGPTFVQVGFTLPASNGSLDISQTFPAAFEQLVVFVQKVGEAKASSPQFTRQQEMPAEGNVLIVGVGDKGIPAGQPITLNITGLPHHSPLPRWITLAVAGGILIFGALAAWRRPQGTDRTDERKRLIARREKLLQDLVRLETDRRRNRIDAVRYQAKRQGLIEALEHVYGTLDDDVGPPPAGHTGVAA